MLKSTKINRPAIRQRYHKAKVIESGNPPRICVRLLRGRSAAPDVVITDKHHQNTQKQFKMVVF